MIKKEIIIYKNYGRCLKLSNSYINCLITIDIGPRIIYYGKNENLLFEDSEDFINKERKDLTCLKDNFWHIYGGHRLWKAPEDEYTYYPDNLECEVKYNDEYVVIASKKEFDTKLQKELWVKMNKDGSLDIKNVINRDTVSEKQAAWSLNVLKPDGIIYIPLSNKNTGYLPNRSINFWSYTDILDDRIKLNNDSIVLKIEKGDIAKEKPLKIGTFSVEKKVYYLKRDCLLEFETKVKDSENFPDYNSNIEIYTINKMVEVEFLTKFNTVDKKIELCEKWSLYDKNSKQYEEIKNKIL